MSSGPNDSIRRYIPCNKEFVVPLNVRPAFSDAVTHNSVVVIGRNTVDYTSAYQTVTAALYYNTTSGIFRYYNGSAWANLAAGIGPVSSNPDPLVANDWVTRTNPSSTGINLNNPTKGGAGPINAWTNLLMNNFPITGILNLQLGLYSAEWAFGSLTPPANNTNISTTTSQVFALAAVSTGTLSGVGSGIFTAPSNGWYRVAAWIGTPNSHGSTSLAGTLALGWAGVLTILQPLSGTTGLQMSSVANFTVKSEELLYMASGDHVQPSVSLMSSTTNVAVDWPSVAAGPPLVTYNYLIQRIG